MSIVEETMTATVCKNCERTFEGRFCPNCSQKAATHRFTLKHFAYEFFHAFTHADKGMLFLIKELFRKPGKVALEFVTGKRKKYFNPFSFLLIAMALNVFLTQKTNFYDVFLDKTTQMVTQLEKKSSQTGKPSATSELEKTRQATPKILENTKLLSLMCLPILALLTWLFFKKSGFNYAENLVMNIFIQGQLSVFFILFCIIPFLLYRPLVIVLPYLFIIATWLYSLLAYKQFFKERRWVNILKGTAIQVLYFAIVNKLTYAVIDYL
jgi:hypothetical protein